MGGFAESVALTASGQPPGTTISFAPSSITGAGTSSMVVSVPPDVAEGTYAITVTGTSGSSVRSAPLRITTAPVRAIGVSFVGSSTVPMGAAESAGVVPQTNWNNATGAARTSGLALIDAAGNPTTATATWSSSGNWMTPITDQPGNRRLMKGYIDTTNTSTTTVTLAGLPQQTYDVYVYVDGDNKTYDRSATYAISGPGMTTTTVSVTDAAGVNFGTTFTRAANSSGNYVKFTVAASGFTLTATPTLPTGGTRRAPVNGIQVVPVATAGARLHHRRNASRSRHFCRRIDNIFARHRSREWIRGAGRTDTRLRSCGTGRVAQFDDGHRPRHGDLKVDSTSSTPIATSALHDHRHEWRPDSSGHRDAVGCAAGPDRQRDRDPVCRQQQRADRRE